MRSYLRKAFQLLSATTEGRCEGPLNTQSHSQSEKQQKEERMLELQVFQATAAGSNHINRFYQRAFYEPVTSTDPASKSPPVPSTAST